jgi:hypothetical protein
MLWNVGIFTRGTPCPTKTRHLPVTFGPALPLHWQLQGQEVPQTPAAVATCGYFTLVFMAFYMLVEFSLLKLPWLIPVSVALFWIFPTSS